MAEDLVGVAAVVVAAGLWWQVRRRGRADARRPHPRGRRAEVVAAIAVDDDGVRDDRGTVAWADVQRVSLVVRAPRSVPLSRLRWAFTVEGSAGRSVAVPAEHTEALLARAHRLAGFDHGAVQHALAERRDAVVTLFNAER